MASQSLQQEVQHALDLAVKYHVEGQLQKSEVLCRKVLEVQPEHPVALHILGMLAYQIGDNESALDYLHKTVLVSPGYVEARNNLGIVLFERGMLDEAEKQYKKAIKLKPDFAEAYNNLGNAQRCLGRLEQAVQSYRLALNITDEYLEARNNLGVSLSELSQYEAATECFNRVLEVNPNYADAHNNLAYALLKRGQYDDAIERCVTALELQPDFSDVHCNLADLFEKSNQLDQLKDAVDKGVKSCPDDQRLMLWKAQVLRRDGEYQSAREVIEAISEESLDEAHRALRAKLLGEVCDRLGDYKTAFSNFKVGNQLASRSVSSKRYNKKRYISSLTQYEQLFSEDWVANWTDVSPVDDRDDPVFLVGFPRSGTTLLDTVLRSHPEISVAEEVPAVEAMVDKLESSAGSTADNLASLDSDGLAVLREVYFKELDQHLSVGERKTDVVIDKLPLNIARAGIIHRVFPNAKFILALRHPYDCVLSCFMRDFALNDAMVNFLELKDAAALYDHVMRLWSHYCDLLPLNSYQLKYEELVENFEGAVKPLLEYLNVDWSSEVENYAETARERGMINTPSYDQVIEPIYTRASGRWEHYREEMASVLPVLELWARHYGYRWE
ncbi:hypothetical protein BOW53_11365 [Solemya pervernicosa gill symbiont]|uniref:Uncharacterized protein n=2 Tax=Solemya pervernicosa gill symbiont TaxID=642797 RepID=A0A1T2L349_9GAMM|nr:hypothetical protein BOW53_11365 [Solemya pervernicosa gill symbiont]